MALTLEQLNSASPVEALQLLDGLYEHSPWIAQAALARRPFQSIHQLKFILAQVVSDAPREAQLSLIRAHPELAGKAMVGQSLTAESSNEQSQAGLTHCSAEEFARLQQLNADYNAKFGWPFILAVRGPRGTGLSRAGIIATFERRLQGHPDFELQECLRNIHRIAEIRLNDKFGCTTDPGDLVWDWQEQLSQYSEAPGQLTVTYLTEAHRACASFIATQMQTCGFDNVGIDAVGNVVGRYDKITSLRGGTTRQSMNSEGMDCHATAGPEPVEGLEMTTAQTLLTGSHYDTVRNGGKYDGRLGIFVPMACVRELHRNQRRLPFAIEVVAFAEEEGQRFKATFLGSGALTGDFKPEWLDQVDADGVPHHPPQARPGALPGLCRSAHRAGPGAQCVEPAAGRSDLDQRQRALQRRGDRHRLPRGHHADEPAL